MPESGSAPMPVAPQGQAPRGDEDARPGITATGLLPSPCSPQLRQPREGPQGTLSPRLTSLPTAHPAGPPRSPPHTVPAQPRSLRPQHLPTCVPLPAALSSVPQFPLLKTGADRRMGPFRRAAGDGAGRSGTPQPPPLHKACGAARREGLACIPPPRAGTAGVPRQGAQGHVRTGQTEQERVRGRETAPWQGKAAGLPSAGRLGTPHKAASVRASALPAPLGSGTGWLSGAGWQPGQGPPPPPAALGGWGLPWPAEGPHLRAAG